MRHSIPTLILLSLFSVPAWAQAKLYAVLVGIENYEHSNLRSPALKYPVEDVTELAAILRNSGYDVTLLTDDTAKSAALRPTRTNIDTQVATVLGKCQRADTVVLAFAGHGLQFEGTKDAYFCPQDAKPFADKTETLVSMKKIYGELESSFAGVKLIFVDACRNDPDPGRGRGGLDADSAPPPKGVGALFSCSAGQKAFEHDNLKHGVFFHYVLQGLQGEAQDKQGRVTFQGLSLYVQDNVPGKVANLFPNREQLPNLRADLVGSPPVLVRLKTRDVTKTKIDASNSSQIVVAEGAGSLMVPFTAEEARTSQQAWAKSKNEVVLKKNSIGMDLLFVPPGEFTMGDHSYLGKDRLRRVRLTNPFWMGRYEVNRDEWAAIMENSKSKPVSISLGDLPAIKTWQEANLFCAEISRREKLKYRLPTEAEWEWSCRAGTTSRWSSGNDQYSARFNFRRPKDLYHNLNRTMEGEANAFGFSQMHGNAAEWCSDVYIDDKFADVSVTLTNPEYKGPGKERVARGGSFNDNSYSCESHSRRGRSPGELHPDVGFRVVVEIRD